MEESTPTTSHPLRIELNVPELRLAEKSDAVATINVESEVLTTPVPTEEPVIFQVRNLKSVMKISIQRGVGAVQCLVNLEERLAESELDAWFRLEAEETVGKHYTPFPTSFTSPSGQKSGGKQRVTKTVGTIRLQLRIIPHAPLFQPIMSPIHEQEQSVVVDTGVGACMRCSYLDKIVKTQQVDIEALESAGQIATDLVKLLEGIPYQPDLYEDLTLTTTNNEPFALSIPANKDLTHTDVDHIKITLVALNEKLKSFQITQHQLEKLRKQLDEAQSARSDLEATIGETCTQFKVQLTEKEKLHMSVLEERAGLLAQLSEARQEAADAKERNEQLVTQTQILKQQLAQVNCTSLNTTDLIQELDTLKSSYAASEEKRGALHAAYTKATTEFERRFKELSGSYEAVVKEKVQLKEEISTLMCRVMDKSKELDTKSAEVQELKGQVLLLESKADVQVHQLGETINKENLQARSNLQKSLAKIQVEFTEQCQILTDKNESLIRDKHESAKSIRVLEKQIALISDEVNKLKTENARLVTDVTSLEQVVCVKQDEVDKMRVDTTNTMLNAHIKDQLNLELNFMADQLLQQSQRNLNSQKVVRKLKDAIDNKDREIEMLKQLLLEARPKHYEANPEDPLDVALSNYLNSRDEPLLVAFSREDYGVYNFGTRRIFLKMERDKLIAKIGGGYMFIDELIEIYTPLELERLQQRQLDDIKDLARKEKIVNKMLLNTIETRKMSPQKAAALVKENLNRKFTACVGVLQSGTNSPGRARNK